MDKNNVVDDNEQPCCSKDLPFVDFETAPESVRSQVPRTPSPNKRNGEQHTRLLPYTVEAVDDISEVSNMDPDGSYDSNSSTDTITPTNATPPGHRTDDDEAVNFHAATNHPQSATGGQNTDGVSMLGNRQFFEGYPGALENLNVGGEAQPPRNPYPYQQRTNTNGIQLPNFAYSRTSNFIPQNPGVTNQQSPQYQYSNPAGTQYQHSTIFPTTNDLGYPQNPVVTNPRNTPQQYANDAGMQYPNSNFSPTTNNYMGYHQNLGVANPHNLTSAGTNEQVEEECEGHEFFSFLQSCIHNLDLAFTNTPNASRLTTCLSHLGQLSKIVLGEEEQFNSDFFRNEHANHNSSFCDVARKENKEKKKARKIRKSKKAPSTQPVSGESDTQ